MVADRSKFTGTMTMIVAILVMAVVMVRGIVVVTDIHSARVRDIVIDTFAATVAMVVSYGPGENP